MLRGIWLTNQFKSFFSLIFVKNARKKVKCVKKSLFFTHFFFTHFREKTKLLVRKKQNTFFPLIFFARAKNGRFLVTRKKCVKKSYFVFNEQIVICLAETLLNENFDILPVSAFDITAVVGGIIGSWPHLSLFVCDKSIKNRKSNV
jgi:hypothetical protein